MKAESRFAQLPDELIVSICQHLRPPELARMQRVSVRFRALVMDNLVWKGLFHRDWSGLPSASTDYWGQYREAGHRRCRIKKLAGGIQSVKVKKVDTLDFGAQLCIFRRDARSYMAGHRKDGAMAIWDLASCKQIQTFQDGKYAWQVACGMVEKRPCLALGRLDGQVQLWDPWADGLLTSWKTGKSVSGMGWDEQGGPLGLGLGDIFSVWSPEGDTLGAWVVPQEIECVIKRSAQEWVVGSCEGAFIIDCRTRKPCKLVSDFLFDFLLAPGASCDALVWSGLMGIGCWDFRAGRAQIFVGPRKYGRCEGRVLAVSRCREGRGQVAVGFQERSVQLWDLASFQRKQERVVARAVLGLAALGPEAPDCYAIHTTDSYLHVWDTQSDRLGTVSDEFPGYSTDQQTLLSARIAHMPAMVAVNESQQVCVALFGDTTALTQY